VRALAGVKLPAMIKDVCVGSKVSELLVVVDDSVEVDVEGSEEIKDADDEIVEDVLDGEDDETVEDGVDEDGESVVADDGVDAAAEDESTVVDDTKPLEVLKSDELADASSELEDVDVVGMEDDDAAENC
jgi:hypothetical protein